MKSLTIHHVINAKASSIRLGLTLRECMPLINLKYRKDSTFARTTYGKFNLDQLKQNACRTLALIDLIERSSNKVKAIVSSSYYPIFGLRNEQSEMVSFQNKVTQRLVKNLERTLKS